ncbi:inverted formin-2-like protein [Reticulomyxa filosa]|uniref:Inverted formin-2-like protein n=1 Tax=Reticulomyxa filosa TaxID=46433 RepID=X6MTX7_RETFI|nr:inverted formin-2-like protein [Reticulomyxa filosa]|eukprot:ETO17413.1 inverted formin-2-like protein [Reticulomyxa filosa]
MSAENKINANGSEIKNDFPTDKEKDQIKTTDEKDFFKNLGELFWLDNTLRMNSSGRLSTPLYGGAISIFYEKYARETLSMCMPPWLVLPSNAVPSAPPYNASSPPMHGIESHGMVLPPPPPPFGLGFSGPGSHPYLPPPGYQVGPPPPGNMPICPPGLEPTVKLERSGDSYNDVSMR